MPYKSANLPGKWNKNDTIELNLPMPIRRIVANEKVADNRGRVALQRGPIVFCGEFADNTKGQIFNLYIPDDSSFVARYRQDLLGGVMTLKGRAVAVKRQPDGSIVPGENRTFVAIPYYAWAHRGMGQMRVWMARTPDAATPAGN